MHLMLHKILGPMRDGQHSTLWGVDSTRSDMSSRAIRGKKVLNAIVVIIIPSSMIISIKVNMLHVLWDRSGTYSDRCFQVHMEMLIFPQLLDVAHMMVLFPSFLFACGTWGVRGVATEAIRICTSIV
jgi:hypothetical protein